MNPLCIGIDSAHDDVELSRMKVYYPRMYVSWGVYFIQLFLSKQLTNDDSKNDFDIRKSYSFALFHKAIFDAPSYL